ncbi:MAG: zf-HC2 domain-containing protein [Acidobacteriota bacterium]
MSKIHQLLPWFFNGTLDVEEAEEFERHLPDCEACRHELDLLETLRPELDEHGAALLADHPSPEELLASCEPESADVVLDETRRGEVLRHLALCATCAEETRWLRGEGAATVSEDGAAEPGSVDDGRVVPFEAARGRSWIDRAGWWVAAAAVVLLAVSLQRGGSGPASTGLLPVTVVRSVERDASGSTVVTRQAETGGVHVLLEVDFAPASFPIAFELQREDGTRIHRDEAIPREALLGGALLGFACAAEDCLAGRYHVRITSSEAMPKTLTYTFELTD